MLRFEDSFVPAGSKHARSPGRPADKTKKGPSGLWLAARPLINLKMVAYNFTIYLKPPDTETTSLVTYNKIYAVKTIIISTKDKYMNGIWMTLNLLLKKLS